MKVLVIGSGGREHALAWKLAQSPKVTRLYIAPGNPGTAQVGANVPILSEDLDGLLGFAEEERIDLTVVGPEAPLVAGIVDRFREGGRLVFGPTEAAARLEGSKHFAKEFMRANGIPTARSETFDALEPALAYVRKEGAPIVVKADGLAAGKGVTVALDVATAARALSECFESRAFGEAGGRVVIEEYLEGEEVSVLAICDGTSFLTLPSSQDHKRLLDNDQGPNTGGMGAYSPAPALTEELRARVEREVLQPTMAGMARAGTPYVGVLYAGMMLTSGGPKVLEFNCRMGDPETQAVLPMVENDLFELFHAAASGGLQAFGPIRAARGAAVCVVLASEGYPGSYPKGRLIEGLESLRRDPEVVVFHAGTRFDESGRVVTAGGRVLGVTARGDSVRAAIERAYRAVEQVRFEGMSFRRDIGRRAIARSG
ncbi:MAG: phosphoribosylamine--glycine ligase [Candidatus Omnitrophica bacterium]|nr:Phosphoribosylamine--glycine ligase [bacterium]NUN95126.1 phosphoribosylamine--glycine ligase [Candidatus Omnitrophota bacterium]